MWAEEFGLGEMGLMPAEFWSLNYREFEIKRAAFARAEDRLRAIAMEHSLVSFQREKPAKWKLEQRINSLRRYPIKQWLR